MATKLESAELTNCSGDQRTGIIDSVTARRKASNYASDYIGGLLMGVDPILIPGDSPVWRVRIVLSFPGTGIVGDVGILDVDAYTATVLISEDQAKTIERTALDLAQRTPHKAGR